MSNLAEGAGRGTDKMLTYAVRIARGSLSELECQVMLSRDLGFVPEEQAEQLIVATQEVSRMTLALIRRLAPKS